jgi:hypothetical protein
MSRSRLACSVTTAAPTPAPAAAPAARAASDLVNVYIESQPSAAEIWIDGEFVGSTNISYALAPGKRAIELRKSGFESWKRELTVRAGSPTRIRADLTPLPRS